MKRPKLLLDTNIVVDYICKRKPSYVDARNLMILGYVREVELWITTSQFTDLVYILTDGGKPKLMKSTLKQLRELRQIVNVFTTTEEIVDKMLLTTWEDPEDFLLYQSALSMNADAIITRNASDFEEQLIKICDCKEFFNWVYETHSLKYSLEELGG